MSDFVGAVMTHGLISYVIQLVDRLFNDCFILNDLF